MTTAPADNPVDRRIAIMDLFDSGEWSGSITAQQLASRLGCRARSATIALAQLNFGIARRASTRRERTGHGRRTRKVRVPRQWARPSQWPELYELQRRLRRMGMSASSVKKRQRMYGAGALRRSGHRRGLSGPSRRAGRHQKARGVQESLDENRTRCDARNSSCTRTGGQARRRPRDYDSGWFAEQGRRVYEGCHQARTQGAGYALFNPDIGGLL